MSTERILVHSSILDKFSVAFQTAIENFYPAAGPGPILAIPTIVQKNKDLIHQAVSHGAKVTFGDLSSITTKTNTETRMRPIVLENVNSKMDIYRTESFGPSVSLFAINSEEEAIAIANDTEYGLSAAVFTRDLATGLRVARRIESGYLSPFIPPLSFPLFSFLFLC